MALFKLKDQNIVRYSSSLVLSALINSFFLCKRTKKKATFPIDTYEVSKDLNNPREQ